MRRAAGAGALMLSAVTLLEAQNNLPVDLRTLVDSERAFAETATRKGIRDSFLEYFSEDAIAFNPEPVSATARLRSRPARPFSDYELRWEPRLGDVAASGELGWLTGPSTFTDHTDPNARPQPGNYLSVWRRRPDRAWRVFIDIGSQPPQPVSFEPGFTRMTLPSRYTGKQSKRASTASLLSADRALNAGMAASGPAAAYADVVTAGTRLHRSGFMPSIGPEAIRAWMDAHAATMSASTGAAEAAHSADLGYSYGTFALTTDPPLRGAYVRLWQRDASGTWIVVADVTQ